MIKKKLIVSVCIPLFYFVYISLTGKYANCDTPVTYEDFGVCITPYFGLPEKKFLPFIKKNRSKLETFDLSKRYKESNGSFIDEYRNLFLLGRMNNEDKEIYLQILSKYVNNGEYLSYYLDDNTNLTEENKKLLISNYIKNYEKDYIEKTCRSKKTYYSLIKKEYLECSN